MLIRNSIEARTYKEKLRLRSYGTPRSDDRIFFEIKKKYKGVVYKRRISTTTASAEEYIRNGTRPESSQIMNEIEYAMSVYRRPKPRMLIAYDREAFFATDSQTLRLTFDTNLRYRTDELALERGSHGKYILNENEIILEIKTDGAMPLWLSRALSETEIYPTGFSKYANAYRDFSESEHSASKKGTTDHVTV